MFGLTNLWSVFSVEWFLVERNPLVDTSKQFTLQLRCVMSVVKWAYLLLFSVFRVSMFLSAGQVSSYRWITFLWLSMITMSGFCEVTQISGGIEPPPGAVCPGKSLYTVYFSILPLIKVFLLVDNLPIIIQWCLILRDEGANEGALVTKRRRRWRFWQILFWLFELLSRPEVTF